MKFARRAILMAFILLFVFAIIPLKGAAGEGDIVYVAPIEKEVERGLAAFLDRVITTAEEDGARAIIFEIDTPGGFVAAANEIAKLFSSTDIKLISFINKQALSAGSYIALYTDEIYMTPGSTMGAAAVVDQKGNMADKKAQSYWKKAMKGAAEQGGRDPLYAVAMADESVDLPEYDAKKGELLTLTAAQALEVGYSEGTVNSLDELLEKAGLADAKVIHIEPTFAEKLARFLTNPAVVAILLMVASLGLVVELFTPGFGVAGITGLSALALFFSPSGGRLCRIRIAHSFYHRYCSCHFGVFLPGGIAGVLGFLAIAGSLFLAAENIVTMGLSILAAIAAAILLSIIMVKVFGKRMKIFKKLILKDSTSTEKGYVSNRNRTELIGLEGIAITPLRPSGTVLIEDERIDVVSEGNFIQKGQKVKIIKAEGSRIVVRELPEEENEQ